MSRRLIDMTEDDLVALVRRLVAELGVLVPQGRPAPRREDLLDQAAAAAFLTLRNPRTLAQWRLRRKGPRYVRLGTSVRYRRSDLEAWLRRCEPPADRAPVP